MYLIRLRENMYILEQSGIKKVRNITRYKGMFRPQKNNNPIIKWKSNLSGTNRAEYKFRTPE